ncbi:MAG: aminotransferase class I/II-fold pyridoxal phosphate-dependent enzyme [bacterium]|nr:aminotransferase class I/II-fold pyridoxal phosphate-dependent enzyme [bacterium]
MQIGGEELTLCHSTTIASLAILYMLKSNGHSTIIMESPYYYATYSQALALGFKVIRIPTYFKSQFDWRVETIQTACQVGGSVLWITQPRIALGLNQNIDRLSDVLFRLPCLTVIVDEASETRIPSWLSQLAAGLRGRRLIRFRGIGKGLGINGIRLAMIIHHQSLKAQVEDALWVCQGALDVFSLEYGTELLGNWERFRMQASTCRVHINKMYDRISRLTRGSRLQLTPISGGYAGCYVLDMSHWNGSAPSKRRYLLELCRNHRTVILLGASMGFALDHSREYARINYYLGV